ncbi:MAG: hypothetical protein QNJ33_18565 [Crocosphaera sp.]|nr:hypothetical protein [Crocosphaera sp.]
MPNRSYPQLQEAGIMFADIRGYNNIKPGKRQPFHARLFRRLWDQLTEEISPELEHCYLWGDSLICISKNLAKLTEFSLKIAKAFEQKKWKGNVTTPLRLRISLDYRSVSLSDHSPKNRIEQYLSPETIKPVKPPRLEPVVRPGQVWCTENFLNSLRSQNNDDLNALNLALDTLKECFWFEKYQSDSLVARIRYKREGEETFKNLEANIKKAYQESDKTRFCQAVENFLRASDNKFLYLSEYLSWYDIIIEMINKFKAYQEGFNTLNEFKMYIEKQGWMSLENKIYFTCFLAKCKCHIRETNLHDLQEDIKELEELFSQRGLEELKILMAETYKEVAISLIWFRKIPNQDIIKNFVHCHEEMFSNIFSQLKPISPRFFPELSSLLIYQTTNHRVILGLIETALFIECLSREGEIKNKFREKKELLANWLIIDFQIRKNNNDAEIVIASLAYIILKDKDKALKILKIKEISSDLKQELKDKLETLADFPRMDNGISDAALYVLDNY